MNTQLEKSVRSSDEWYTPKEILDALGKFDLDPCNPSFSIGMVAMDTGCPSNLVLPSYQ